MFRIGLDFDGLIANTPELKARVAKEQFQKDISPHDMLGSHVVKSELMSISEYRALLRELYVDHPEWHQYLEPMPGAFEGIEALRACGCDVICITSRIPRAVDWAQDWVRTHKLDIAIYDMEGHTDKVHRAKSMGLSVFADDDPQYVNPMIGIVPHLFLYDWPYNHNADIEEGIQRVAHWPDLVKAIQILV